MSLDFLKSPVFMRVCAGCANGNEATAAIDPVREQQIYQKFLKLYQDTTTIMITHRLGATSLCDWIIAIEDGKAMEQGSHEDLMTKNGIYCEMYETQRRWYL